MGGWGSTGGGQYSLWAAAAAGFSASWLPAPGKLLRCLFARFGRWRQAAGIHVCLGERDHGNRPISTAPSRACPHLVPTTPPRAQDGGQLSLLALSCPFLGLSWKGHTFLGEVREDFLVEEALSCISVFECLLRKHASSQFIPPNR